MDWERVVREEGPAAWRTACRLLGNRHDAEECLQDALADAVSVSARQPVQNWRGLLQHLTAARALDRLRRRYRESAGQASDFDAVPDPHPPPSQHAEERELVEKLREALPTLPGEQAQVFVLHCVEQWSYREIGQHLSLSTGAVGMLLLRARTRLKEILAGVPGAAAGGDES